MCSIGLWSCCRSSGVSTDVCEAICRGLARKQKEDAAMGVSTMKMSDAEVRSFAHYVCNLHEGKKSGIRKISSINETGNSTTPVGDYPEHWVDNWHGLEGGNDLYGVRPQSGVTLLQAEMNGLSYNCGYETAWDDASNENIVPELVHAARALEMEYFHKLGVYESVTRDHQACAGGKIIGVRWVDVNKGDALHRNYRSRLVGREFNVGRDDALYVSTPPSRH